MFSTEPRAYLLGRDSLRSMITLSLRAIYGGAFSESEDGFIVEDNYVPPPDSDDSDSTEISDEDDDNGGGENTFIVLQSLK